MNEGFNQIIESLWANGYPLIHEEFMKPFTGPEFNSHTAGFI